MKRLIGTIVNGKLVKNITPKSENREHSLHRQYVRDRMREEYARDIVQPYKGSQINQEYIEAWGKDEAGKQYGIERNIE